MKKKLINKIKKKVKSGLKKLGIGLLATTALAAVSLAAAPNIAELDEGVSETNMYILSAQLYLYNIVYHDGERALLELNTPGGDALAMKQFISKINKSKVVVDTYVSDSTASAGAFLWAQGDRRYVEPDAVILFHGAHLQTYALTQVTISDAVSLIQSERGKVIMAGLSKGLPSDVTFSEMKSLEVIIFFLKKMGNVAGLEQEMISVRDALITINEDMVTKISNNLIKTNSKFTKDWIRTNLFNNFKTDNHFTGQQLYDMGIATALGQPNKSDY